jgi:hypothetical protein
MKTKHGASRRGVTKKYVAVAWIILLEVILALYLYSNPVGGASQNPFIGTTSTTTTTTKPTVTTTKTTAPPKKVDKIEVESALIVNDTLMMKVHNLGPSATHILAVASVCTPGFQTCYNYKSVAGAYRQETFVLPAGRTFAANLSKVCIIAIPNCRTFLPVANATYYVQIKFTFADGQTVLVPVSAMANDTWSPYYTAIMGVTSASVVTNPLNLTGLLNVTVTLNDSLPYASWTTLLQGQPQSSSAFSKVLLTNKTGCAGSASGNFTEGGKPINVTFTADCSQPLPVNIEFSTVLIGIGPGPYYVLVVRDTTDIDTPAGYPNYDAPNHTFAYESNFAIWIQAHNNSTILIP